jgi:hypothetical protein
MSMLRINKLEGSILETLFSLSLFFLAKAEPKQVEHLEDTSS